MTNDKQEAVLRRIRALLEKTTKAGCTEAEAAIAADKASKLMNEYNLTMSQVEIEQEEYSHDYGDPFHTGFKRVNKHHARFCASAVAELCNCENYSHGFHLVFFGSKQDTQIAHYLMNVIKNAMESEYKAHCKKLRSEQGVSYQKPDKKSFQIGMASRLNDRIRAMIPKQNEVMTTTGKSVAVIKNAVLRQQWAKHGVTLRKARSVRLNSSTAYQAGMKAGNNVQLNRGVNQAQGAKLIG